METVKTSVVTRVASFFLKVKYPFTNQNPKPPFCLAFCLDPRPLAPGRPLSSSPVTAPSQRDQDHPISMQTLIKSPSWKSLTNPSYTSASIIFLWTIRGWFLGYIVKWQKWSAKEYVQNETCTRNETGKQAHLILQKETWQINWKLMRFSNTLQGGSQMDGTGGSKR